MSELDKALAEIEAHNLRWTLQGPYPETVTNVLCNAYEYNWPYMQFYGYGDTLTEAARDCADKVKKHFEKA